MNKVVVFILMGVSFLMSGCSERPPEAHHIAAGEMLALLNGEKTGQSVRRYANAAFTKAQGFGKQYIEEKTSIKSYVNLKKELDLSVSPLQSLRVEEMVRHDDCWINESICVSVTVKNHSNKTAHMKSDHQLLVVFKNSQVDTQLFMRVPFELTTNLSLGESITKKIILPGRWIDDELDWEGLIYDGGNDYGNPIPRHLKMVSLKKSTLSSLGAEVTVSDYKDTEVSVVAIDMSDNAFTKVKSKYNKLQDKAERLIELSALTAPLNRDSWESDDSRLIKVMIPAHIGEHTEAWMSGPPSMASSLESIRYEVLNLSFYTKQSL